MRWAEVNMGMWVAMMPLSLWDRAVIPGYVICLSKSIGSSGDQSSLINVCERRWGWLMFVWFLLGCGPYLAPALGSLSLPWAWLTVPGGIVQTCLQTFPEKGQQQPGEEAGAEGGGPGGCCVALGDRNWGWGESWILPSLELSIQPRRSFLCFPVSWIEATSARCQSH